MIRNDEKTAPVVFGKLRSLASASNVCSGVMILILAFVMDYAQMYLLFGILIIAAALWALTNNPTDKNIVPQHKQMILKKKYWLFYFLTFMAGAIFSFFSLLLVQQIPGQLEKYRKTV